MAETNDGGFGFDASGTERIIRAVRTVEGMPAADPGARTLRKAPVLPEGRRYVKVTSTTLSSGRYPGVILSDTDFTTQLGVCWVVELNGLALTLANYAGNPTAFANGRPVYVIDLSTFGASGTNHSAGHVPDPGSSAGTTRFLREDATWQVAGASSFTGARLKSTGKSLATSPPGHVVSWIAGDVDYDTSTFWSNSNPTRLTAAATGYYDVRGYAQISGVGAATFTTFSTQGVNIFMNGGVLSPDVKTTFLCDSAGSAVGAVCGVRVKLLSQPQYFELVIYNGTTGTQAYGCFFEIEKIG